MISEVLFTSRKTEEMKLIRAKGLSLMIAQFACLPAAGVQGILHLRLYGFGECPGGRS